MNRPTNNGLAIALTATILSFLGRPSVGLAHHSTAEYDATRFVEARGEVVSVLWRNPHIRFQVSTKSADGNDLLWDVERGSYEP